MSQHPEGERASMTLEGAALDLDAAWLEVDELVRRFESQDG
jgi:hypothetical protein